MRNSGSLRVNPPSSLSTRIIGSVFEFRIEQHQRHHFPVFGRVHFLALLAKELKFHKRFARVNLIVSTISTFRKMNGYFQIIVEERIWRMRVSRIDYNLEVAEEFAKNSSINKRKRVLATNSINRIQIDGKFVVRKYSAIAT